MLEPKTILRDRYQLESCLSHHRIRQTWLARDLQTATQVVIKLIGFNLALQWDDLKLFEREAETLRHLDHPQIPTYLDYFTLEIDGYWSGLVQQYIPGQSLRELLQKKQRFTEAEARKVATEILTILIYLHEPFPVVLHRDIKPSNIIWSAQDQIYLVDFGAVQTHTPVEGKTFTVVGTYGYTPLEQFGGRSVPASDLYALGMTLIHLLTGISPAELPQKRFSDLVGTRTDLSQPLVAWLDGITHPYLDQRFSTAQAALQALQNQTIPVLSVSWQDAYCKGPRDLRQLRRTGQCPDGDLRGADLQQAYLREANLMGTDLIDADLTQADLVGANLIDANLINATLQEADLRQANLNGASLRGSDLRGAQLQGADLRHADLRRSIIDEKTQLDLKWQWVWRLVNERGTAWELQGIELEDADLRRVNLSGANLVGAKLAGSILAGAILIEVDLRNADLRGADLRNTRLLAADLRGIDLRDADLRGANVHLAQLDHADLRNANLSGVHLWRAKTSQGAVYDRNTRFRSEFEPTLRKMRLAE